MPSWGPHVGKGGGGHVALPWALEGGRGPGGGGGLGLPGPRFPGTSTGRALIRTAPASRVPHVRSRQPNRPHPFERPTGDGGGRLSTGTGPLSVLQTPIDHWPSAVPRPPAPHRMCAMPLTPTHRRLRPEQPPPRDRGPPQAWGAQAQGYPTPGRPCLRTPVPSRPNFVPKRRNA